MDDLSSQFRACHRLRTRQNKTCIIISEDAINELINTVNVLPVTTRKPGRRVYPNEVLLEPALSGLPMNLLYFVIK